MLLSFSHFFIERVPLTFASVACHVYFGDLSITLVGSTKIFPYSLYCLTVPAVITVTGPQQMSTKEDPIPQEGFSLGHLQLNEPRAPRDSSRPFRVVGDVLNCRSGNRQGHEKERRQQQETQPGCHRSQQKRK